MTTITAGPLSSAVEGALKLAALQGFFAGCLVCILLYLLTQNMRK